MLSNAFDNALNACCKITDKPREISLTITEDGDKVIVTVVNFVIQKVSLGKDGLPLYERTEEHGWGLSSIRCITEKHNGLLKCISDTDTFTLTAVLFRTSSSKPISKERKRNKTVLHCFTAVPLALITLVFSLNRMPSTINALEQVPYLGEAVEIIDFRTWGWQWGDSGADLKVPETNNPTANEIIAGYVAEFRQIFLDGYNRKHNGYAYTDLITKELINDQDLFVVEMSCTIMFGSSASYDRTIMFGSSASYDRYFALDKSTGEIITLQSLFKSGTDWNGIISTEIRRQIQERVDACQDNYFGFGDWAGHSQEFKRLSDDVQFHIEQSRHGDRMLVITFDEQAIGAGTAVRKFRISYNVIKDILKDDCSFIREVVR